MLVDDITDVDDDVGDPNPSTDCLEDGVSVGVDDDAFPAAAAAEASDKRSFFAGVFSISPPLKN